ncbi:hypothetical protein H0A36_16555 [Endozoicomonas sp. SM1973]|uniref:Uncharacterized protein n=1 Tax=Spartinivicinus marinus TaxID=2994442 RepID=A0A853IEM9_9GAMM|nr:hypothetical protein [Spartinivicinus marinus]
MVNFVISLLVEYQLVIVMLGLVEGFISHRVEFEFNDISLMSAYNQSFRIFIWGQEHALSQQYIYIIPSIGLAVFFIVLQRSFVSYFTAYIDYIYVLFVLFVFIGAGIYIYIYIYIYKYLVRAFIFFW